MIGGSPCQGFSFAGKQLNFDDPRSKLFFEYVRLKNELNPKYFLLENVKMKKEYQDIISSYLGVEPIMINSNLTDVIFSVGVSYFGYTTYRSIDCLIYIQEKLKNKNFLTLIISNKDIFISWKNDVNF